MHNLAGRKITIRPPVIYLYVPISVFALVRLFGQNIKDSLLFRSDGRVLQPVHDGLQRGAHGGGRCSCSCSTVRTGT